MFPPCRLEKRVVIVVQRPRPVLAVVAVAPVDPAVGGEYIDTAALETSCWTSYSKTSGTDSPSLKM